MSIKKVFESFDALIDGFGLRSGQRIVLAPALIYGHGDDERWSTHIMHGSRLDRKSTL